MKKCICLLLLTMVIFAGCQKNNSDSNSDKPVQNQTVTSLEDNQIASTSSRTPLHNETQPNSTIGGTKNEVNTQDNTSTALAENDTKKISLKPLSQYPELPTGCEVTSLTMVLNHYGVDVDKCDIADNYLDKGEVGSVNFYKAFEGDPRDDKSFGCYAPVIVNAAKKVIDDKNAKLKVSEITGNELESLYSYIDEGKPVIVWGTLDCQQGHYSMTWEVDGETLRWFTPEHCMVLVGYDNQNVWVADPVHGDIRSYNKDVFKLCYNSLYKQAVLISR